MTSEIARKVDWLSWVHKIEPVGEGGTHFEVGALVHEVLSSALDVGIVTWLLDGAEVLDYGRAPYKFGWRNKKHGVSVWASPNLPHFTVEVSGRGCDGLKELGWLEPIVAAIYTKLTRIDIAVDMETDVSPRDFASLRDNKRTKTTADMSSTSGETVYVGSMRSERYARVYRYSSPHPRSALLRVEHVYRRDYAKSVGEMLVRDSLRTVCASSAALYGWTHPLVERWGKKVKDIEVSRPERNGGKTLSWMVGQVAPAFRRLVQEGIIPDAVRFLEIYFLSDYTGKDDE